MWKFRKADRVIYHQAPTQSWHFYACGKTATRFVSGEFDSKVWLCAGCLERSKKEDSNSVGTSTQVNWSLPRSAFRKSRYEQSNLD